jgi:hypothetical protein
MMIRALAFALAVTLAACSQGAPGGAQGDAAGASATAAQPGDAHPPAGAEDTITAWARGLHGVNLIEPVAIFYGDYSGDGAADALAWAHYLMGGSGAGLTVGLFRNEGGRMVFVRTVDDVYGSEPRDVRFAVGRITLTTTMPNPGDPHCCPTGSQAWTIDTN